MVQGRQVQGEACGARRGQELGFGKGLGLIPENALGLQPIGSKTLPPLMMTIHIGFMIFLPFFPIRASLHLTVHFLAKVNMPFPFPCSLG